VYRLLGVLVPAEPFRTRGYTYTMSWEMYRALEGKAYTAGDKLADEQYENTQKVQTLWWDNQGFGHVALLGRNQRDVFERNRRVQQKKKLRDEAWRVYEELQRENAFNKNLCDRLLELRKTLEELDNEQE